MRFLYNCRTRQESIIPTVGDRDSFRITPSDLIRNLNLHAYLLANPSDYFLVGYVKWLLNFFRTR